MRRRISWMGEDEEVGKVGVTEENFSMSCELESQPARLKVCLENSLASLAPIAFARTSKGAVERCPRREVGAFSTVVVVRCSLEILGRFIWSSIALASLCFAVIR